MLQIILTVTRGAFNVLERLLLLSVLTRTHIARTVEIKIIGVVQGFK